MTKKDLRRLSRLRQKIDQVDQRLLKILRRRFEIVEQIGKEKAKQGLPVYQKSRSWEVLRNLAKAGNEMGLDPVLIKSIYELIFSEAVKRQKKVIKAQSPRLKR